MLIYARVPWYCGYIFSFRVFCVDEQSIRSPKEPIELTKVDPAIFRQSQGCTIFIRSGEIQPTCVISLYLTKHARRLLAGGRVTSDRILGGYKMVQPWSPDTHRLKVVKSLDKEGSVPCDLARTLPFCVAMPVISFSASWTPGRGQHVGIRAPVRTTSWWSSATDSLSTLPSWIV